MKEKEIKKRVRVWRIVLALLIGLAVSGYLLYDNLSSVMYEEVKPGKGNYSWVDSDNDGHIDNTDPEEFTKSENGNYIRHTYKDALNGIEWTLHSTFWLIMAVIMMICRDLFYMVRIRVLTDNELSWRQAFRVIMTWEFASALSPGVVGGAAVAMFILNKEKIALGKSTAIVMVTLVLDNLFYLIMIPLAFILIGSSEFFPSANGDTEVLGTTINIVGLFWVAYVIVLLIVLILIFGIIYRPGILKRILVGIFSFWFLKRWKDKAAKTGDDIIITSRELKDKPMRYWIRSFGATVLSWTGRFLVVNCIMAAFISTGLMDQLIIYARQLGMWVIMIISPTPGGSGVAEYAFTEFLDGFIPFGLAGLLAVLWRLISYYPYLFIGVSLLPRWFRK